MRESKTHIRIEIDLFDDAFIQRMNAVIRKAVFDKFGVPHLTLVKEGKMKAECFKCEAVVLEKIAIEKWIDIMINGRHEWLCPECAKPKDNMERSQPPKPETR